jgi:CheY-like chemotaxis protein
MILTGGFGRLGAESIPLDLLPTDRPVCARRVLVVEDERSIRELVSDQLRRAGYDCQSVGDGREGLQLLLQEPFDAIVLDLMLPHVDGLTICRTIRQQGVNQDAPILMLTARIAESEKVLGLQSGADDYVTKPFGVLELTRPPPRAVGSPPTGSSSIPRSTPHACEAATSRSRRTSSSCSTSSPCSPVSCCPGKPCLPRYGAARRS